MFDVNAVAEAEAVSFDLFTGDANPYKNEIDRLFSEAEKEEGSTKESAPALSLFLQDLSNTVSLLWDSQCGQALVLERNDESTLVATNLSIEETEDGLTYDPYNAEIILFDLVDSEGNSYKKIFHMVTEQVQMFYE